MHITVRSRSRTNTRVHLPNTRAADDFFSRCNVQTVGLQSSSHSLGERVPGTLQDICSQLHNNIILSNVTMYEYTLHKLYLTKTTLRLIIINARQYLKDETMYM